MSFNSTDANHYQESGIEVADSAISRLSVSVWDQFRLKSIGKAKADQVSDIHETKERFVQKALAFLSGKLGPSNLDEVPQQKYAAKLVVSSPESFTSSVKVFSFADGTKNLVYPDGTKVCESRDKAGQITVFTEYPAGRLIASKIEYQDGRRVFNFGDGTRTTCYPEGTKVSESRDIDGRIITVTSYPKGHLIASKEVYPDGRQVFNFADGAKNILYEDGTRISETKTREGRFTAVMESPDGKVSS